jgi:mono/diheme cytochrome c family protein
MSARLLAMPALKLLRRCAALTSLLAVCSGFVRAAESEVRGLTLTVTGGGKSDVSLAPNVWLNVPAGQPATPFVAPGQFTAKWEGTITAELRADFAFHGEFTGHLKLTVGETVALDADGTGDKPVDGKTVRLNKGANKLVAEYAAPNSGDAFVRLFWSNKETPYNPLPLAELRPAESAELKPSQAVRAGRDLFAEARCVKCHTSPAGMPELAMDAPAFDGIGSRRNFEWMARWIEYPHAKREFVTNDLPGNPVSVIWHEDIHGKMTRPMPKLFWGKEATAKAEAAAAYLASLKSAPAQVPTKGEVEDGKTLFEKLHCGACHESPEHGRTAPHQISLKHVNAKFPPGALSDFLRQPERHFAWIRMPNFNLSGKEADNLAEFLQSVAEPAQPVSAPAAAAQIELGRKLVTEVGCLNCHGLSGSRSTLSAKPLAEISAERWDKGCLLDQRPAEPSGFPSFNISGEQRAALRAFAATDHASLSRHTQDDFLARQSQHLNCRECHGKHEGFPGFEILYGKLKPEWATKFIAGTEPTKPRPWLESRMPAFPAYAQNLAEGLSMTHGFGPKSVADSKPAEADDLVKSGHKLVGSQGGLQCISCHPVNELGATQVFEAPGINLGHSFARLEPSFFRRWLRAPTSIQADSKMPVYFDEDGRSPLPDIQGGDGPKTIQAVWEYLRLGKDMPKPE